jgi:ATP synthase F1 delta subunit
MMNGDFVARNYAIAFLNTFIDEISFEEFLAIREFQIFWEEHKKSFYCLNYPGLIYEKKRAAVEELLRACSAPAVLIEIFSLLIRHRREKLIALVLENVCSLYMEKKDIVFFHIASSHELSAEEITAVQEFLAHKTKKTILYTCLIDKDLIAGIRCQSESLVWEFSVRQQLDDVRRQFIVQGLT